MRGPGQQDLQHTFFVHVVKVAVAVSLAAKPDDAGAGNHEAAGEHG
tara:strand:- start:105 stop:242 length:138 start_codon:yes stop_codon:yes gene_type:complete